MHVDYEHNSRFGWYVRVGDESSDRRVAELLKMEQNKLQQIMIEQFGARRRDVNEQVFFDEKEQVIKAVLWIREYITNDFKDKKLKINSKPTQPEKRRKVFQLKDAL